jgi:hypothetical protein
MSCLVKTPWIKVVSVLPLDNYRLQVFLENDKQLILDLKELIETRKQYWRLKHLRYFHKVGIDAIGGICWPGSEDLAPDGLQRYQVMQPYENG